MAATMTEQTIRTEMARLTAIIAKDEAWLKEAEQLERPAQAAIIRQALAHTYKQLGECWDALNAVR